jgi:predicted site-specific integrase-resolvase
MMSNDKKTRVSYAKPSRADIARSVATSTAVETGQSSTKIEASLEATRKKFAHLRLAV